MPYSKENVLKIVQENYVSPNGKSHLGYTTLKQPEADAMYNLASLPDGSSNKYFSKEHIFHSESGETYLKSKGFVYDANPLRPGIYAGVAPRKEEAFPEFCKQFIFNDEIKPQLKSIVVLGPAQEIANHQSKLPLYTHKENKKTYVKLEDNLFIEEGRVSYQKDEDKININLGGMQDTISLEEFKKYPKKYPGLTGKFLEEGKDFERYERHFWFNYYGKAEFSSDIYQVKRTDTKQATDHIYQHTLEITRTTDKQVRSVTVYEIPAWKDMSTLELTDKDIDKLFDVYKLNISQTIYTHCESGKGRTGVVLAAIELAHQYEEIYKKKSSDKQVAEKIIELINNLRLERPGLLQTDKQLEMFLDLGEGFHQRLRPASKMERHLEKEIGLPEADLFGRAQELEQAGKDQKAAQSRIDKMKQKLRLSFFGEKNKPAIDLPIAEEHPSSGPQQ